MKVVHKIENGPILIAPDIHKDERGYFYESFNDKFFRENVCDTTFVQDNQSKSSYGVLRGMHFQKGEHAQAKLVRVIQGEVIDVVLDIREDSPNYGKYYTYTLSQENHYQLFVPRGFAHGFISMRDDTIFQYKCDNPYCKESEGSYRYNSFGFDWTTLVSFKDFKISKKDEIAPYFNKNINKKKVEITKDAMWAMVSTPSGSLPGMEIAFNSDIYAEVITGDEPEPIEVKLLSYSLPLLFNPGGFEPYKNITVIDERTGRKGNLSPKWTEVKWFYRYE